MSRWSCYFAIIHTRFTRWSKHEAKTKQTYRVGQNTGPVWALIIQRWLPVKRRVICQKF